MNKKYKDFKVVKCYPNSPDLDSLITYDSSEGLYVDNRYVFYSLEELQANTPEFFEEIKELKEYEILEINANVNYKLQDNGLYLAEGFGYHYSLEEVQKNTNFKITKIKRTKDNEVFQIGDIVINPAGHKFTIGKFYLDCNQNHMLVGSNCGAGHVGIHKIKKAPKVLFTTEDGVEVTKNMSYWYVVDNSTHPFNWTPLYHYVDWDNSRPPLGFIQFSTKEKAQEYITKKKEEQMLDKPLLSYNEVKQIVDSDYQYHYTTISKLKELVKSKM